MCARLKYFLLNLERITDLASLMWLLCNQVESRVANNVCEIDVLRPRPVKRENTKLCQTCQRAVRKTRHELQENDPFGFVLDRANFRQHVGNPPDDAGFKSSVFFLRGCRDAIWSMSFPQQWQQCISDALHL